MNDDFIHHNFQDINYVELRPIDNNKIFNKNRVFEIKLPDCFAHHVREDLKATDLFNEIRTLIGISKTKSDGNIDDIHLNYNRFWNLLTRPEITVVKECWKVISPGKNAWKNDIRYIYPKNENTHNLFLNRLYIYGIQQLLDSLCDINHCNKVTVFSFGLIVVQSNDPTNQPYWHIDHTESYSKLWNVLIPIDLPVVNDVELFIKDVTNTGRKTENDIKRYKYQSPIGKSYGLAWNGGVKHATNRKCGNTGDPRIMLCLCAGELPRCRELLCYMDIEKQLFGWTKEKMTNIKSVLNVQDNCYHCKGQVEYIVCEDNNK